MPKIITVGNLRENKNTQSKTVYMPDGLCPTLQAAMGTAGNCMPFIVEVREMNIKSVGNIGDANTQSRTVYLTDGVSPTLCSGMEHGNTVPYIVEVKDMDVKIIGQMDNSEDHTFESANRVYDDKGISPTITTNSGGDHLPKIVDVEKVPTIKIRQATTQGFIECEVGGGGRPELSNKPKTQRKGARQRSDMPDSDNGGYP